MHLSRVLSARTAVSDRFAERVDSGLCPASVVAVFDSSGLIWCDGFGDRGDGQRPTLDTAFRIASVTKSFTAATMLMQVERGFVGLDQPVDELVPVGRLIGPDGALVRPPTVGELLSMSAGLPNDDPWADRQESMSSEEFASLIAAGVHFCAPPGRRYEYSNLGFALAGAVIEKVTGRSFVQVVTDDLITPLGLVGVGFDAQLGGVDVVARGQVRLNGGWQDEPFTTPGAFSPIGGIVASPRGLAGWLGWLASSTDDRVLSRASRSLMTTARTPIDQHGIDPTGYGLGLVVQQHHRHGLIAAHSGGYPGFGAHVRWHVPSGLGVLAMENARYSAPVGPVTEALLLMLDESSSQPIPPLWPQTLAARDLVERLLRHWDDQVAADLFADNIDLDQPIVERRAAIAALIERVGPLTEPLPLDQAAVEAATPAQLTWTVQGARGQLRCQLALTPTEPPLVQTLTVTRR